MSSRQNYSRRSFATTAASLAITQGLAVRMVHANPLERPTMPSGAMTGDVTYHSAVLWSRCDRPAEMVVQWATDPEFRNAKRINGPRVDQSSDFTGKLHLTDLPSGELVYYHVWFETSDGGTSEMSAGHLTLPSTNAEDVFFAWSGDTAGQGFGINPDWGGMKIYSAIERLHPQFFVHVGDMIYADNPIPKEIALADGTIWKNIVTPAKSKPAVSVDDFRGNYAYNLMDTHMRSFHATVPQYVMWDDHETTNNWYPGQELHRRRDAKAYEGLHFARELAENAKQAFFEFTPIGSADTDRRIYRSIHRGPLVDLFLLDLRSYRGNNSENLQETLAPESAILGEEQLRWLKEQLRQSKAVWKIICSDMPLGVIVADNMEGKEYFEAVANRDPGVPKGRELEMADLLGWMKQASIANTVWITADVHYAAAHYYDPSRAAIKDAFLPFWEFVAGPLHAGSFGPNALDGTFGPEVKFQWVPKEGVRQPVPPSGGMQSFGTIRVEAKTKRLEVVLRGPEGNPLPGGTFSMDPSE